MFLEALEITGKREFDSFRLGILKNLLNKHVPCVLDVMIEWSREICSILLFDNDINKPRKLLNKAVKLAINNYRSRRYHQQWKKYFYELSKYVHDTWTETIKKKRRRREQGKYFYVPFFFFFWTLYTNSIKRHRGLLGWRGWVGWFVVFRERRKQ